MSVSRIFLVCGLAALALAARTYGIFNGSIFVDDVWSLAGATGHSLDIRLDGRPAGESYADPQGPVPASFFLEYLKPQPGNNPWHVAVVSSAAESHPPLYQVFLYLWMCAFGYTIAAGRAFSLFFSLASILLLFGLARRLAGERAAWIACLLCAVAPFQSYLAVQVRGYTLYSFLVLATAWLTFEILEQGPGADRVRLLTWLGVAGILTHYYFVIYSFLQGLALLTQRRSRSTAVRVGTVWTAVIAALGFYALVQPCWLVHPPKLLAQDVSWMIIQTAAGLTDLLVFLPEARDPLTLPASLLQTIGIRFLLVAALGVAMLVAARNLPRRHMVFLLTWLAAPILLIFAMDWLRDTQTVNTARYYAGSSFASYLLLAAGLAQLKPVVRWPVTAFVVLVMLTDQLAYRALPTGTFVDGSDCRQAAMTIGSGWKSQDLVIVQSSYGSAPISLAYYLPPQAPMLALIYFLRPEQGPIAMSPSLDTLQPRLEKWVAGKPHIWVLRMFTDVSARDMDSWLLARYRRVNGYRYGSLLLFEMAAK